MDSIPKYYCPHYRMSGSGSNQPEPMALATMLSTAEKSTKGKRGKAKLVQDKKKAPTPQDSPAMCTRSKVDHSTPESPALHQKQKEARCLIVVCSLLHDIFFWIVSMELLEICHVCYVRLDK